MLRNKCIDHVCCLALAVMLLLTFTLMGAADSIPVGHAMGYEDRLFDQSRVHTLDIVIDDWDEFLETCTSEEYSPCTLVVDGENQGIVGIRAKGNTSLSNVAAYGNNRYSFKIEFDHYQAGRSYHGLDKLSLNNLIQDKTLMKDYLAYTLMNMMGVAAPLCSYVQINVNGEYWGLYLAVEGVEDSFLSRNYGSSAGELYKPDSMSFGGGRGNGRDFDMSAMQERFGEMFGEAGGDESAVPDFSAGMPGFGGGMPDFSGGMPDFGGGMPGFSGEESGDESAASGFPGGMPDFSGGMPDFGGGMPDFSGDMPGASDVQAPASDEQDSDAASESDPETSGKQSSDRRQSFGGGGMGFGGMGSGDVKLQYIDDDPDSYSNIFGNAKTDITEADQQRLIQSLKALSEGDTSVVDIQSVISYFVVHNFMCNDDSYTGMMIHNYYLHESDGVLSMIPWDYNLALGGFSMGGGTGATSVVNTPIDSLVSMGDDSDRPMVAWITGSEEYSALYREVYAEFVSEIWNSGWLLQEIKRVQEMLSPYVAADPTAFFSPEEFAAASEALREFCSLRLVSISGQLNGTIPSTSAAQRIGSASLIDASGLSLSALGEFGMGGGGFGPRSSKADGTSSAIPESGSPADGTAAQNPPDANAMTGMQQPPAEDSSETLAPETQSNENADDPSAGEVSSGTESTPFGQMPFDMSGVPSGQMPFDMGGAPSGQMPSDMSGAPSGQMPSDMSGAPSGQMPSDMGGAPSGQMPSGADDSFSGMSESISAETDSDAPPDSGSEPSANASAAQESSVQAGGFPEMSGFDNFFPAGMNGSSGNQTRNLMLLAVSLAVLLAALIFAKLYKSGR